MKEFRTLKWFRKLTKKELFDIAYLEAACSSSDVPIHVKDLLVALAERMKEE